MNLFDERGIVLFDAAMGTALLSAGQPKGTGSEEMNLSAPETVKKIHLDNICAGSDMVTSNTFGLSQMMTRGDKEGAGLILEKAVGLAKAAVDSNGDGGGPGGREILVALCVGPTGELINRSGTSWFTEASEVFAGQVEAGTRAGADFILLETFADPEEFECACRAAVGATDLPVLGTMTFGEGARTYMGASASDMIRIARAEGLLAAGANCSLDPDGMLPVVREIMSLAGALKIIVQPNAGQPVFSGGKTFYNMTDEAFVAGAGKLLDLGVSGIGGCCGTGPMVISLIRDMIDRRLQNDSGKNN